jgi:hypothetical protein
MPLRKSDGTFNLFQVRQGDEVERLSVRVVPPGAIELDGKPGESCEGEVYVNPMADRARIHVEFKEGAIRFERVY